MKEELLHYVWKTKSFKFQDLQTTENESIKINKFGFHNHNAGPDFLEGEIYTCGTTWAGHIEIHVLSSDWIKHRHQTDSSYDNVILHVVWEEDEIIYRKDNTRIHCIELKGLIPKYILDGYEGFSRRKSKISCSNELQNKNLDKFHFQLNRIFIERLEQKCYPISIELEQNDQNWSQVLFVQIAKSMGLKANVSGMEALARSIPINLIFKHADNRFQLESLFYGQSGLLSNHWMDDYPVQLLKEYEFLKTKYNLSNISGLHWKLMRMRPVSFPTIRISQLTGLYYNNRSLHAQIMEANSTRELKQLLKVASSEYWETHFLFDKEAGYQQKNLGKSSIDLIIINGIIPFLFAYGQHRSEEKHMEKAVEFMQQMQAENNKITRMWKEEGIKCKNSFESQAIVQLYKNYCLKKRCLECTFGNQIIKEMGYQSENKYLLGKTY